MPTDLPFRDRITFDPDVMAGKACIRGLRITAGSILGLLAIGRTPSEILETNPLWEPDDILAVAKLRTRQFGPYAGTGSAKKVSMISRERGRLSTWARWSCSQ